MEFMWKNIEIEIGLTTCYYYSFGVVTFLFLWQIISRWWFKNNNNNNNVDKPIGSHDNNLVTTSITSSSSQQHNRISDAVVISDMDLKHLMDNLDDEIGENWEPVVDKRNNSLSYSVKCCKPKDGGSLKYLSTTIFNNCSSEMLRDFYMDNYYRKEWDKTLIDQKQLHVDETNGTEIGSMIKKFPLLTPREYILAWRLWEGSDRTYYCYSKECDHPLAPRLKKYVRVGLFRSGWRIREVPGRNACEIKMVHQEDAGLNVEMAKMIFAKGIWSYVCKMDNALRKYTDVRRRHLTSVVSAITLIQKVPLALDSPSKFAGIAHPEIGHSEVRAVSGKKKLLRKPSKKFIANGLILAGGVICLARGHTNFSGKVAMAYMLSKLKQRHQTKQPSLQ